MIPRPLSIKKPGQGGGLSTSATERSRAPSILWPARIKSDHVVGNGFLEMELS